jgi:hypothetical protein
MSSSFAKPFTSALDGGILPLHWRIRSITSIADVRGELVRWFVLAVWHLLALSDALDVPPADDR